MYERDNLGNFKSDSHQILHLVSYIPYLGKDSFKFEISCPQLQQIANQIFNSTFLREKLKVSHLTESHHLLALVYSILVHFTYIYPL